MSTPIRPTVFPAPAGINRVSALVLAIPSSVPRASGDKPLTVQRTLGISTCSPRQRG
ncbi:hypothetical protein IRL29_002985 [Salmonella enterica]|nr:hypothetical protein [Salmonella enterica]EGL8560381.1 hypothetical protein [Salmonella enterica]